MLNFVHLELLFIVFFIAISCALPGTFLILRGTSLMSDALSHAILLGIVLSFFVTKNLHSPFIFIGSTIIGLCMVGLIELLIVSKRVKPDAAIAITFPFLFSLAITLINLYASTIHIDVDAVLLGELAFAPFNRFVWHGYDLGPCALWSMGIVTLLNIVVISVLYPALQIATFDQDFAKLIKYRPAILNYVIMTLTCLTITATFSCAGAVLIVAFMIIPPASAYLITQKLSHMLTIACLLGIIGALAGSIGAHFLNVSIAGCIATIHAVIFFMILLGKMFHKI